MDIEKNYIFVLPLSSELEDLKDFLEQDEQNTVYEMESVDEYGQVIGIMDQSITFSSDVKKTQEIAGKYADYIREKESYNILHSAHTIPVFMSNKLRNLGVNKILKSPVSRDDFLKLINDHETKLANNEVEATPKIESKIENKRDDDNKITRIKNDYTDFSSGLFDNLQDKLKKMDFKPFSQFDNIQRKKIKELNLKELSFDSKIKKLQLAHSPYNKKSHAPKENLDSNISGKLKNFNFMGINPLKPRKKFQEQELKNMSGKLKNAKFDSPELKRKKVPTFDEMELKPKKSQFQEKEMTNLSGDLKNMNFEGAELKRKKAPVFNELESSSKKSQFQEKEMTNLSGNLKNLEFATPDLGRKKALDLPELKTQNNVSHYKEDEKNNLSGKLKHLDLPGVKTESKKLDAAEAEEESDKKRRKFEEVERDSSRAKAFTEKELENLSGNLEQTTDESKSRPRSKPLEEDIHEFNNSLSASKVDEQNLELVNKSEDFIEWNSNISSDDLSSALLELKRHNIIVETHYKTKKGQSIFLARDKKNLSENVLELDQYEDAEFVIIDYRDFKLKKKYGNLELSESDEKDIAKKLLEQNNINLTTTYFLPTNLGLEYYILYNDLYRNAKFQKEHLFSFIEICIKKNFEAKLSLFLNIADELTLLFSNFEKINEQLEDENYLKKLQSFNIPEVLDDTFLESENEFYYPYFEDGEKLGLAVFNFGPKEDYFNILLVESFMMCLKGIIIDLSREGV